MSQAPTLTNETQFAPDERINLVQSIPFFLMHLMPLGAIWAGVHLRDVICCIVLYYVRMFFITAGFHRYFAHRSYRTSRFMQFVLAFGGQMSAQKGALWWASHHRIHHKYSDTEQDVHSPLRGFLWSHVGWILCTKYNATEWHLIKDIERYPELRWLNKFHFFPAIVLGVSVFLWGGWSALFTGFFLSTVLLYHGTFTINSLSHVFGRRRFVTTDTSRNSFLLSLVTLGEGWHNNHHYYQASTRQGFYWWEFDGSYYVLKVLSWFGLVWDLHTPPERILNKNRLRDGYADIGMFQAYWTKAAIALANARRASAELQELRKKAIEDWIASTKQTARQIAEITVKAPSIPPAQ